MKNNKTKNSQKIIYLFFFLIINSLLIIRSFNYVKLQNINILGTKFITKEDFLQNSSLKLPKRLIFIETNLIERELKKNLGLQNISISKQLLPFGLKVFIQTRKVIAYGEKTKNGENIKGYVDAYGVFISEEYADLNGNKELNFAIYGWNNNSLKVISEILNSQYKKTNDNLSIHISKEGFITLEEKNFKKILLGFDQQKIAQQLDMIFYIKNQLEEKNIIEEIESLDLTDPNNPEIKVFKP